MSVPLLTTTVQNMDGTDKFLMTTFIHVFGFSQVKLMEFHGKTAFANAGIKAVT